MHPKFNTLMNGRNSKNEMKWSDLYTFKQPLTNGNEL